MVNKIIVHTLGQTRHKPGDLGAESLVQMF